MIDVAVAAIETIADTYRQARIYECPTCHCDALVPDWRMEEAQRRPDRLVHLTCGWGLAWQSSQRRPCGGTFWAALDAEPLPAPQETEPVDTVQAVVEVPAKQIAVRTNRRHRQ